MIWQPITVGNSEQVTLPGLEPQLLWKQTIYGIPPSKKNQYVIAQIPLKGAKAFYRNGKRYWDKSRLGLMLSPEAKKYQEDFIIQCRKPAQPFECMIILKATIFYPDRRHDLEGDSIIMDSLQKAEIILNDRQIFEKHIFKKVQQPDPRVEIELWSLQ